MELINSKYFYEANSYLHRRKKIGEKILNLHFLYNRTLNEFPDGKAGRKRGKSSNNFWFFSRRANKSLRKLWKRYRFLNWFHFLFRILYFFCRFFALKSNYFLLAVLLPRAFELHQVTRWGKKTLFLNRGLARLTLGVSEVCYYVIRGKD